MSLKPKSATTDLISTEDTAPEAQAFIVITTCDLYEPYAAIYFTAGQLTQVNEITNWMSCQIDAGLMQIK